MTLGKEIKKLLCISEGTELPMNLRVVFCHYFYGICLKIIICKAPPRIEFKTIPSVQW